MKRIIDTVALASGCFASWLLTVEFLDLHIGGRTTPWFCDVSDWLNCRNVALSPEASLATGVPLSAVAFGFFVVSGALSFFRAPRAMRLLSLAGVFASAVYLALMIFRIRSICLLCLGVDASVLVLCWTRLRPGASLESIRKSGLALLFSGVAIAAIGITLPRTLHGAWSQKRHWQWDRFQNTALDELVLNPHGPLPPGVHWIGSEQAEPQILMAIDFKCPHCRDAIRALFAAIRTTGRSPRTGFVHSPCDASCNSDLSIPGHEGACLAAKAFIVATSPGFTGSPRLEELLLDFFDHKSIFFSNSPDAIPAIAEEFRLGEVALRKALEEGKADEILQKQLAWGAAEGISATPTIWIGNERLTGAPTERDWIQILNGERSKSSSKNGHPGR